MENGPKIWPQRWQAQICGTCQWPSSWISYRVSICEPNGGDERGAAGTVHSNDLAVLHLFRVRTGRTTENRVLLLKLLRKVRRLLKFTRMVSSRRSSLKLRPHVLAMTSSRTRQWKIYLSLSKWMIIRRIRRMEIQISRPGE